MTTAIEHAMTPSTRNTGRATGDGPAPLRRIGRAGALSMALVALPLASGCAVVTVVGAAASVAATAASTVVDVGVGAVRVTGKVIGKSVDLVTGGPTPPAPPALPKP